MKVRRVLLALLAVGLVVSGCTPNSIPGTESSPIPEGSYEGTVTWTLMSWAGVDQIQETASSSYIEMFDNRGIPLSSLGNTLVVGLQEPFDLFGMLTGTETVTNVNANSSGLILTWENSGALSSGTPMTGTSQDIYTLRSDGTISYSGSSTLHSGDGSMGILINGEGILSRK